MPVRTAAYVLVALTPVARAPDGETRIFGIRPLDGAHPGSRSYMRRPLPTCLPRVLCGSSPYSYSPGGRLLWRARPLMHMPMGRAIWSSLAIPIRGVSDAWGIRSCVRTSSARCVIMLACTRGFEVRRLDAGAGKRTSYPILSFDVRNERTEPHFARSQLPASSCSFQDSPAAVPDLALALARGRAARVWWSSGACVVPGRLAAFPVRVVVSPPGLAKVREESPIGIGSGGVTASRPPATSKPPPRI